MEPQIVYDSWYEFDTSNGTQFIPADLINLCLDHDTVYTIENLWDQGIDTSDILQYLETNDIDDLYSVKLIDGWGARLSMPGYMDCTEWTVFKTEDEARNFLIEFYDVDFNDDDEYDNLEQDSDDDDDLEFYA